MFDWLFEGRPLVYVLLAGLSVISLGLWYRDRRRVWFFIATAPLLLLAVYFLLDRLVETAPEQVTHKLAEMSAGVRARDPERIVRHLAERFKAGALDRKEFGRYVRGVLERRLVDEVKLWDLEFPEGTPNPPTRPLKVHFKAKPTGSPIGDTAYWLVKAEFVREPDGQWRMAGFEYANPFVNTDTPLPIPPAPLP